MKSLQIHSAHSHYRSYQSLDGMKNVGLTLESNTNQIDGQNEYYTRILFSIGFFYEVKRFSIELLIKSECLAFIRFFNEILTIVDGNSTKLPRGIAIMMKISAFDFILIYLHSKSLLKLMWINKKSEFSHFFFLFLGKRWKWFCVEERRNLGVENKTITWRNVCHSISLPWLISVFFMRINIVQLILYTDTTTVWTRAYPNSSIINYRLAKCYVNGRVSFGNIKSRFANNSTIFTVNDKIWDHPFNVIAQKFN